MKTYINFPRDTSVTSCHTRARAKWTENIPINYAVIVCTLTRNYTYATGGDNRGGV